MVCFRRGYLFLWVLGMGYVILLWHSLSLPYTYFVHIRKQRQNFKPLAIFCGCAPRFVSDLVGNPNTWFFLATLLKLSSDVTLIMLSSTGKRILRASLPPVITRLIQIAISCQCKQNHMHPVRRRNKECILMVFDDN